MKKKSKIKITEKYFSDDTSKPSVALANIHSVVPDIEGNKEKVLEVIEIGKKKGANIIIFPEFLHVCHSFILVSNCIPGSPQKCVDSAIVSRMFLAFNVSTGFAAVLEKVVHFLLFIAALMNSSFTRTLLFAF